MIEAFSLPRASPHQLTPSSAGVCARPFLIQLMYCATAFALAAEFTIAFVFEAFRNPPLFWYMNARIRARSMLRHIGAWPEAFSFWSAPVSCVHVFGTRTPALASIVVFASSASGDQSFGMP